MDAERFDRISRLLALSTSRRQMLGRAGYLLGASLGMGAAGRTVLAQDDGGPSPECRLDLVANIRGSPEGIVLIPEDEDSLLGELRFSIAADGALENATFTLDGGAERVVAGQAQGHAFSARVDYLPGRTLVLVGVSLFPIDECRGAVDGVLTGPEMGALGDWHATASRPGGTPTAIEGAAETTGGTDGATEDDGAGASGGVVAPTPTPQSDLTTGG